MLPQVVNDGWKTATALAACGSGQANRLRTHHHYPAHCGSRPKPTLKPLLRRYLEAYRVKTTALDLQRTMTHSSEAPSRTMAPHSPDPSERRVKVLQIRCTNLPVSPPESVCTDQNAKTPGVLMPRSLISTEGLRSQVSGRHAPVSALWVEPRLSGASTRRCIRPV